MRTMDEEIASGQAVEDAAPESADTGQPVSEGTGEYSLADAFREAQAALGTDSGDGGDSAEDSEPPVAQPDSPTPEEPQQQAQTSEEPRTYTVQGALRRLNTLIEQGRHGELTREEAGELNRLKGMLAPEVEAQVTQRNQEAKEFRDLFVDLDYKFHNDRDAFVEAIAADPDYLTFYNQYKADHPGLTYETAAEPPTFSEEQVKQNVGQAIRQDRARTEEGIRNTLAGIAEEHGVDFAQVQAAAPKGVGSLMAAVVEAAATAKAAKLVEKELPERVKAETQALRKELDAAKVNLTANVTRLRPILRDPSGVPVNTGNDLASIFRETKEQLGIS